MIVTDKQYGMEEKLIHKLDLMIKRCDETNPKRDVLLLVEGAEGDGKTTMSALCSYYVHYKTGRPLSNKNFFFSVEKMIEFAVNTEAQIIIWDEPALDGLSSEWWKQTQRNLIKLLMMARKKRHFFIFNITKFHKFSEYIVVDRALGMIHVYSRNELEAGRFVYIRKRALEPLYVSYRSSKKRLYKKYASFRGTFPDLLYTIIDEKSYEKEKDKAIKSIGAKPIIKENKSLIKLNELKYKLSQIELPIKNKVDLSKKLEINPETLRIWGKRYQNTKENGTPQPQTQNPNTYNI